MVPDAQVVKKLFDSVAVRYAERHGGYTRIIKLGRRAGDNAPLVLLELVDRPETPKDEKKGKEKKAAKAPRRKKEQAAAAAS